MSIHPYNKNSSVYNFLFHPQHNAKKKTAAIITHVALSVLTGFLWQFLFWIVNRIDHADLLKYKKIEASSDPQTTKIFDDTVTEANQNFSEVEVSNISTIPSEIQNPNFSEIESIDDDHLCQVQKERLTQIKTFLKEENFDEIPKCVVELINMYNDNLDQIPDLIDQILDIIEQKDIIKFFDKYKEVQSFWNSKKFLTSGCLDKIAFSKEILSHLKDKLENFPEQSPLKPYISIIKNEFESFINDFEFNAENIKWGILKFTYAKSELNGKGREFSKEFREKLSELQDLLLQWIISYHLEIHEEMTQSFCSPIEEEQLSKIKDLKTFSENLIKIKKNLIKHSKENNISDYFIKKSDLFSVLLKLDEIQVFYKLKDKVDFLYSPNTGISYKESIRIIESYEVPILPLTDIEKHLYTRIECINKKLHELNRENGGFREKSKEEKDEIEELIRSKSEIKKILNKIKLEIKKEIENLSENFNQEKLDYYKDQLKILQDREEFIRKSREEFSFCIREAYRITIQENDTCSKEERSKILMRFMKKIADYTVFDPLIQENIVYGEFGVADHDDQVLRRLYFESIFTDNHKVNLPTIAQGCVHSPNHQAVIISNPKTEERYYLNNLPKGIEHRDPDPSFNETLDNNPYNQQLKENFNFRDNVAIPDWTHNNCHLSGGWLSFCAYLHCQDIVWKKKIYEEAEKLGISDLID